MFNNFELALGVALKFYTGVTKRLKLKVRKFWGLVPTFIEVTGEKRLGEPFGDPPSWTELSNILCFSVYISLHYNSKYALR